jgi:hypothetical protein
MKKLLLAVAISGTLVSCGSTKLISTTDITKQSEWLEDNPDNPIINVIQKVYANDDVEIVIKKKFTTDYVKLTQTKNKRVINKITEKNKGLN